MSIAIWSHRLFWCQKKNKHFICRIQLKDVNHWLPRSFVWTLPEDPDSLRAYIDALHEKNKTVTALWENSKAAIDHVYEAAPEGAIIRLDTVKLMAILRGEYVLDIPCTGRLLMVSDRQQAKYMPQEVQAALLAADGPLADMYLQALKDRVASRQPLMVMTEKELESPVVKAHHVAVWQPGMNLPQTVPVPVEEPEQKTGFQEKEIEVGRIDHGTYVEVNYTCGKYFVRRLFRDNEPFYAASSYDAKSWEIFYVNQPLYDTLFQPEMSA